MIKYNWLLKKIDPSSLLKDSRYIFGGLVLMKKKIIRVQPIYTIIICFIAFLICISLMFLPYILKSDDASYNFIWYCIMGVCGIIFLSLFLYYLQFAYIDQNGIEIRGLFYQIVKINWNDIYTISNNKVLTYDSRGSINLNWLVIKTSKKDCIIGRAGRNFRNKAPWYIIATTKNITVISQFIRIDND